MRNGRKEQFEYEIKNKLSARRVKILKEIH